MDVIKTGIPGLDELFEKKGFQKNTSILLSGEPGAGKTIFAIQFLYNGAKKFKEPGIFISIEQPASKIRDIARSLNMDLSSLENKGLVTVIEEPVVRRGVLDPKVIRMQIEKSEAKRIVLDSLTLFKYISTDTRDYRIKVLEFIGEVLSHDTTLLITSERLSTDFDNLSFQPEDFLFDGLILLGRMRRAISFERVLNIVKMRGTKHSEDIYPIEITQNGLIVKPIE